MTLISRIQAVIEHIATIVKGKEDNANKVDAFALGIDETHYPTTNAVVEYVAHQLFWRGRTTGVNLIRGDQAIPTGMHGLGRIDRAGRIQQYSIDAFDETGASMSGSISIRVYKNGALIGTASLTSGSSVVEDDLTAWSDQSLLMGDIITYEVTTNTGIKNAVLTLYYL